MTIGKNKSVTHTLHYYKRRGRAYPNPAYLCYLLAKHWYANRLMAVRVYNLAKRSNNYDKVKIHKNCVYLTRRLATGNIFRFQTQENARLKTLSAGVHRYD